MAAGGPGGSGMICILTLVKRAAHDGEVTDMQFRIPPEWLSEAREPAWHEFWTGGRAFGIVVCKLLGN